MVNDFMTLDEFKVLAARITAKQEYLLRIVAKHKVDVSKASNELYNGVCLNAILNEIENALKKPADFYFSEADFKENTQTLQTTQLNLFGEEFC